MEIRPILSAMSRNKIGALLIALQIALTLSIVTNASFIINQRSEFISRPTGLDDANTFIAITTNFDSNMDPKQTLLDDLDYMNSLAGVKAAITSHSIPVSGSGNGMTYRLAKDTPSNEAVNFGNFSADENGLEAFDLELVAGRNFRPDEITWRTLASNDSQKVVLVSQALADALFPDGDALGKMIWEDETSEAPTEIIGIYDHMQNAWPDSPNVNLTSLQPFRDLSRPERYFIVRTEPGERDRVMAQVEEYLAQNRGRMVDVVRSYEEQKGRTFASDIAMIKLLSGVVVILTVVTSLGIVGLAWFSVTQRRKQIGTRRALGATRFDIMRYFMVENWLITSMGLAIGIVGALGLNWFLDTEYQVGRMPLIYLPFGLVLLWILGQIAVFAPARRAANIPPALATRSV
jgi:putative ABC transport system permease protein